jgi:hypothetical protein
MVLLGTLLKPHILTYLSTVFSRGFGQHSVVCFHLGQCNGALDRSTSSWCHKGAFFSHRRVRWSIHYHGLGRSLSDLIAGLSLMFIYHTKLLVPWLTMVCSCLPPAVPCADQNMQGWYSVRRECRKLTWAFLAIALFFLFAWSMMFYSRIYRFTFIDWPFFGCMTVTSFVALISSTVIAFVCLRNYGKGLSEWCT